MKLLLLSLLLRLSLPALAGEEAPWSKPEKGLRARLLVLPSEKADSPFCRIFIELQNTGDVMGQKNIRFSPGKLTFEVTDQAGKPLAKPNSVSYDGIAPLWKPTLLPYAGTIKFQISFPGLGYHPNVDRVIVDMGSEASWIIPQADAYFLSATLTIAKEPVDHPFMDWSGSLTLPKVEIPKAK